LDWSALIAAKDREIARLGGVYRGILERAGVEVFEGRGAIAGPQAVEVSGRSFSAETILIATGGWPVVPDIPGREHGITSNEVFALREMPRRLVIIGGGYIGLEFAGVFHSLGAEVTVVHRGDRVLRIFDREATDFLVEQMKIRGVAFAPGRAPTRIDEVAGGLTVTLDGGEEIGCDAVLFATGRLPNTGGLGLEQLGVELSPYGGVLVDEHFRSSVPSVCALGDVIHRMELTPVALAEGMVFARTHFGGLPDAVSYENIPTAVFSQPELAVVGLSEERARQHHARIQVFTSRFRPMRHTLSGRPSQMLMKLVVDADTDRVLGVHVVGADAAEIVQGFAVALQCGATKTQLDHTLGIHPTAAEELVTLRTPTRS
jgi:glutathione reductase (NADPH)